MKIVQLRQLVKEVLSEMELNEMPRQPGSSATYAISAKGEDALKSAKASGELPAGMGKAELRVLVTLFKNKEKKLSQLDVAKKICEEEGKGDACQQMVNGSFRKLKNLEFVDEESYVKQAGSGAAPTKKSGIEDLLGDLDI
jgi:hypothetical protein